MTSRDFLPPFLREKYQELDEHPELNEKYEKITDFLWLIKKIWCISNAPYQEWIWVKHETLEIVDSYDDTIMYFIEDADRACSLGEIVGNCCMPITGVASNSSDH